MTTSKIGYASSANIAFSFQTSSGDTIELDMYSAKSMEYSKEENNAQSSESFSFAAKEGYRFKFKTNGLSEQDKAEIAEAMKKIEPIVDRFVKESGANSFLREPLDMIASSIQNELPKPKDENTKRALSSSLVRLFDDSLKKSEKPSDIFEDMRKLLDKILKNIQNPQNIFYA